MLPTTWIVSPFFWACTSTVTGLVTPRSVSSPVAVAVTGVASAGTDPSSIGAVSVNVAVGKLSVSIRRPRNWLSRRSSSLTTVVRSASNEPSVTCAPASVSWPVTWSVRPTPSVSCPNSTSTTR